MAQYLSEKDENYNDIDYVLERLFSLEKNVFDRLIAEDTTGIGERVKQAIQEIVRRKAEENAMNFLRMDFSVEKIAQGTGLSVERVCELAKIVADQNKN